MMSRPDHSQTSDPRRPRHRKGGPTSVQERNGVGPEGPKTGVPAGQEGTTPVSTEPGEEYRTGWTSSGKSTCPSRKNVRTRPGGATA